MKELQYHLDKMDLDFLFGIERELTKYFGDKASEILLHSSFLERLAQDPEYVYHYEEGYWANVIKQEYEAQSRSLITN